MLPLDSKVWEVGMMDAREYERLCQVAHETADIPWELRFQAIRELPDTTYWLARAIEILSDRDPVDALNDSEYLFKLMSMRCNQELARTQNA